MPPHSHPTPSARINTCNCECDAQVSICCVSFPFISKYFVMFIIFFLKFMFKYFVFAITGFSLKFIFDK